jgi:hypothetical protein
MKDQTLPHLKRPLRPLIALILANPDASNARIARLGRCDARRVSRYRRAIETFGYTADELLGCGEGALQGLFKRQQPKRIESRPDFHVLDVELPNASALVQWQHYRSSALAQGDDALSYSGFNRARRTHRRLARTIESRGPGTAIRRSGERGTACAALGMPWHAMRLVGDVDACIRATVIDGAGASHG